MWGASMNAKSYYVLLSMVDGIGPRRMQTLIELFGNPKDVWFADEQELKNACIPPSVIEKLLQKRNILNPEEELEKLYRKNIRVISIEDAEYPLSLREIYDPPRIIYIKGQTDILSKPMIAVVGSRRASHYGLSVAKAISHDLSQAGICVVSGLARGIDTAAHSGALQSGGLTVAVLGCGLDVVYPKENKKLMDEIVTCGAVISEFPPGTPPYAGNFPQRNRLISGLARGVLVIEAAEKSGSLITADYALEQGRDVYAVPGQVTNSLSRGAHGLIKQGAKLVETANDILEEMGFALINKKADKVEDKLTPDERRIYYIVSDIPINLDYIIEKSGLEPQDVFSTLTILEIKGMVKDIPGQGYVRVI